MPRYFNLPRLEFTTLDDQLVAINNVPLTESVLIVGPAIDGPTNLPVRVNNAGEIERLFGPVVFTPNYVGPNGEVTGYSGNALMKAVREVQSGGAADIRVMRVGGSLATGTFTAGGSGSAITGTITFEAKYNGRIYNTSLAVQFSSGTVSGQVVIYQPTVKGGNITISYADSTSGTTLGSVIDQINAHPENRTVRVTLGSLGSTTLARDVAGTVSLTGGTDGTIMDDNATNKVKMYADYTDAASGSFLQLADYEADNVVLVGIYLDDVVVASNYTRSIATDFANFLGTRTVDHPMLGIIGIKPLDDPSSRAKITTHYNALITTISGSRAANWSNAGYFMNAGFTYSDGTLEQPIDTGAYLQVVAGDVIISDPNLNLYVESAAAIYAGTIASLKPHQATTHKRVSGIYALPYEFTRAQLDTLTGGVGRDLILGRDGVGAYVTVRRIQDRGILFTKDVTASRRSSDFNKLQPLRIANSVHKGIKDIAFDYLGKENSIQMRTALQSAIKGFLDTMAEAGALLGKDGIGYIVEILGGESPQDRLLGTLHINVMLRPNFEITNIQVRVRLSL